MTKDTNNTRPTKSRKCYACGHDRPDEAVRPFGRNGDRIVSWICAGCDQMPQLVHAAPTDPRLEMAVA
jgi:hypothetical protein